MVRLANIIGATQMVLLVGLVIGAGWQGLVIGVLVGSATAVGWLLASRIPGNPLGWMLLFIAGCFASAGLAYGLGVLLKEPAPTLAAWCFWYSGADDQGWIWLPAVGLLFTQVLLRFPDGRLPSPRWRGFSRVSLGLLAVTTILAAVGYPDAATWISEPGLRAVGRRPPECCGAAGRASFVGRALSAVPPRSWCATDMLARSSVPRSAGSRGRRPSS